jgi:hypothetical protein
MFYKVLNSALKENDIVYSTGLNIDKKFDDSYLNGMYFYSFEKIISWLTHGSKLAFISIPDDSKVIHFEGDVSKADKIYIDRIIDVKDLEMWNDEQICLEAVKQNGKSLQYVRNQTDALCLEAVKQNGFALEYVRNRTDVIVLEAMKQNPAVFEFLKN